MKPEINDPDRIHRTLVERILMYVETPGRYIGGEVNSIRKPPSEVEVDVALLFPDTYEVGMSFLGYQILYAIINGLDWAAAERAYAVWPDMHDRLREHGIPLYAVESFRPVREFDVVGFSFQYEMLCTNVLAMLDLAGVPLRGCDRGVEDPVVIAGGPGTTSPEPMAPFIDLFFIGDAEESIVDFLRLVRKAKAREASRQTIIAEAARSVPGVYAPALYEPQYAPDGAFTGVKPTSGDLPCPVRSAHVSDLGSVPFPTAPIVPSVEVVHDRINLEIMRGCTRGCRFCQAGMLGRPQRMRSADELVRQLQQTYYNTGYDEVALSSLSSSDYKGFQDLLRRVNDFAEPRGISISLPSLRVSDQLELLPRMLSKVRKSGLTVAPEAGTERLRRVINKDITDEELLSGARAAFEAGWRKIKLYFMIGLPTETEEDIDAIVALSERVSNLRREVDNGPAQVNVTISPFVPKPHTPFQWEPMAELETIRAAMDRIRSTGRLRSVRYMFHEPERSLVEAALARGDRRLAEVIERAWRDGARFDAWGEHFSFQRWQEAFGVEGLRMEDYANRRRSDEEPLPWDHVDCRVSKDFLLRERDKARRCEMTPDCRVADCSRCGACPELYR